MISCFKNLRREIMILLQGVDEHSGSIVTFSSNQIVDPLIVTKRNMETGEYEREFCIDGKSLKISFDNETQYKNNRLRSECLTQILKLLNKIDSNNMIKISDDDRDNLKELAEKLFENELERI